MLIENQILGTSFGPGGSYKKDVERSIKQLGFKFQWGGLGVPLEGSPDLASILANIKISIPYVTKYAGQANHSVAVALDAMVEHWAASEGTVLTIRNEDSELNTMYFCVDICENGALPFLDDETLTINIIGLPTIATFRMSIWGIEAPIEDFTMKQWHNLQVPAGTLTKQFEMHDYSELVCPKSNGAFQELQLTYSNGRVINITEEEAKLISLDSNDLSLAGNYDEQLESFSFSSNYILNVKDCTQVLVKTNGTAYNLYAVGDQVIAKPSKVAESHNAMRDTTADKIQKEAFLAESKK